MKTASRIILFLIAVASYGVQAKDVGAVYIKNSGKNIMHLWVNGSYQGFLRPGETRYSVSDGFITNGSDRPTTSGGRTPVEESHGGWENDKSGSVELTFQYPGDKRQTNRFSANGGSDVAVGVNESSSKKSPEPPIEDEIEKAPAILKGTLPNLTTPKPPEPQVRPQQPYYDDGAVTRQPGRYLVEPTPGPRGAEALEGAVRTLQEQSSEQARQRQAQLEQLRQQNAEAARQLAESQRRTQEAIAESQRRAEQVRIQNSQRLPPLRGYTTPKPQSR